MILWSRGRDQLKAAPGWPLQSLLLPVQRKVSLKTCSVTVTFPKFQIAARSLKKNNQGYCTRVHLKYNITENRILIAKHITKYDDLPTVQETGFFFFNLTFYLGVEHYVPQQTISYLNKANKIKGILYKYLFTFLCCQNKF